MRLARCFVPAFAALVATACATRVEESGALRFSVKEGRALNEFYRQGPVAAHLVVTSGPAPRVVVAFPAGNSGVALWLIAPGSTAVWQPDIGLEAAHRALPDGGALRGITAELVASGGSLIVTQAIVSSVRVIRDYGYTGQPAPEVLTSPQVSGRTVTWERRRMDGAPGYHLSLEMLDGSLTRSESGSIELTAGAGGRMRMRLVALTGDEPLTPIPAAELLAVSVVPDERLRNILAFLAYEEKLLAGSWRFNTYFGRDTLLSLRLLAPVLQPRVMEAGLASVLERLDERGEVAHEEDIGEYAVLRRVRAGQPPSAAPIFDYKMIDDDFMLAIVAAHYLLETESGRERAADFLARRTGAGRAYGARLVDNLRFVVAAATPFARDPAWERLISLKRGEEAGNWRDSGEGLGGGRYPYDVNGVFVPAALDATARLHASGVLKRYIDPAASEQLAGAAGMAEAWLREAPRAFEVAMSPEAARAETRAYARRIGVDSSPALATLGAEAIRFRAVALDAGGRPVPVMNSDEAFVLLFLEPSSEDCERIAANLSRPFPAGLLTDVGLLVANPAYAPDALEPSFDRNRYHGTVIWSWQQAMFAAGMERQLTRDDLTSTARDALIRARERLRAAIDAGGEMRGSELWSWSQVDGQYRVEAFGQRQEDETESNAAQLWSTVHLARP